MKQTDPEKLTILIIDDELQVCNSIKGVLESRGIGPVHICTDSREALEAINTVRPSMILLDLTMPFKTGMEVLEVTKDRFPEIPVIVITGVNEIETAMECIRLGARDYLVKAIENQKLLTAVGRVLEIEALKNAAEVVKERFLSNTLEHPGEFTNVITQSHKMTSIFLYLEAVAPSNQPVLIRGETGTGKEEVAAIIHRISGRNGEFINVNVAGLDDTIFSDTLFGHRKGAYTGADGNRLGLISSAGVGTLFLDEIGELSPPSQIKLLRLLESGEYYPLGSDVVRRSECRIVAATNKALETMMEDGQFRRDLYYRLKIHEVVIPPLHNRREDIPLLVSHFVKMACSEMKRPQMKIPLDIYRSLNSREYPGNIRELKGLIFDAVSMCRDNVFTLPSSQWPLDSESPEPELPDEKMLYPTVLPTLKEAAGDLIEEALNRSGGNISVAAGYLGITQSALSQRLLKDKKGGL